MRIFGRKDTEPDPLAGVDLGLEAGDRVLAACVDTGSYDNDADVLHVSWVDRAPDLALRVGGHRLFLQAFRERVQASVVVAENLDLGSGRAARLVIRKDLAQDRLLDQVLLGKGVRLGDPGVRRRVELTRQALREQVGLP